MADIEMTPEQKAAISKSNAETIGMAKDAGLINSSSAMKDLRQTAIEGGLFSNITDEEIAEAEELDANPPLPDMPPEQPKVNDSIFKRLFKK